MKIIGLALASVLLTACHSQASAPADLAPPSSGQSLIHPEDGRNPRVEKSPNRKLSPQILDDSLDEAQRAIFPHTDYRYDNSQDTGYR